MRYFGQTAPRRQYSSGQRPYGRQAYLGRTTLLVCCLLLCCFLLAGCDSPSSPPKDGDGQNATQNSLQNARQAFPHNATQESPASGADHIRLNGIAIAGEREMPIPVFAHERHTRALAAQGKSCGSCHLPLNAGYAFSFQGADLLGTGHVDQALVKNHFHSNCISCHQKNVQAGLPAGPLAESCRSCHTIAAVDPVHFESGYDKALHYKHISSKRIVGLPAMSESAPSTAAGATVAVSSPEQNCGACHSMFDSAAGQRVWKPGTEDSCRACHLPRQEQARLLAADPSLAKDPLLQRVSLQEAVHTQCVNCHLAEQMREEAKAAATGAESGAIQKNQGVLTKVVGPVECRGCHNAPYANAMQARIAAGLPTQGELPDWAWRPVFGRENGGAATGPGASVRGSANDLPSISSGPLQRDSTDAGGIPRLMRGQSDATLILAAQLPSFISDSGTGSGFMSPVSFNHAFHEGRVNACRSCHHKEIAACTSCHTIGGRPVQGQLAGGKGTAQAGTGTGGLMGAAPHAAGPYSPSPIPLNTAMHAPDSVRSCVGCHNRVKAGRDCAGCHTSLPVKASQESCVSCHSMPRGLAEAAAGNTFATPEAAGAMLGAPESGGSMTAAPEAQASGLKGTVSERMLDATAQEKRLLLSLDKEAWKRLAAEAALSRADLRLLLRKGADIPEIIRADALQHEYEAVHMPHNAIIEALLKDQASSRLAGVFHAERDDLCRTCHHHSPPSRTPPRCVSCHSLAEDGPRTDRPPLKEAYHLRCFGCHTAMQQAPAETDCQGCHKPVHGGVSMLPQQSVFARNVALTAPMKEGL